MNVASTVGRNVNNIMLKYAVPTLDAPFDKCSCDDVHYKNYNNDIRIDDKTYFSSIAESIIKCEKKL